MRKPVIKRRIRYRGDNLLGPISRDQHAALLQHRGVVEQRVVAQRREQRPPRGVDEGRRFGQGAGGYGVDGPRGCGVAAVGGGHLRWIGWCGVVRWGLALAASGNAGCTVGVSGSWLPGGRCLIAGIWADGDLGPGSMGCQCCAQTCNGGASRCRARLDLPNAGCLIRS